MHARQGLGEREGRNEEARVEGRILLAADLEALDEGPGIGEYGGEGDGLREADDGCVRRCVSFLGDDGTPVWWLLADSPRRKSWPVGKSSGLRGDLCLVRVIVPPLGGDLTVRRRRNQELVRPEVLGRLVFWTCLPGTPPVSGEANTLP